MSKRPLRPATRSDAPGPASALRRHEFPALINFVRGYLHQDLPVVHGSARAAVAAFCADATPEERRQLAREMAALVAGASLLPLRALRGFVTRELGSAWVPSSREELAELLEILRGPSPIDEG